jgi:DNA-binding LytR/AlgR family response regulator
MQIPDVHLAQNTVHLLDVKNIIYITSDRNKITIQTHSAQYRPLLSLKDFYKLLNDKGFEQTDKSTIVQLRKITRFDPVTKIAFFEEKGEQTKAATIAQF